MNGSCRSCADGAGASQRIAALNGKGDPLPEEAGLPPIPRDRFHASAQLGDKENLANTKINTKRRKREHKKKTKLID